MRGLSLGCGACVLLCCETYARAAPSSTQIALQFPDSLLGDAVAVVAEVKVRRPPSRSLRHSANVMPIGCCVYAGPAD